MRPLTGLLVAAVVVVVLGLAGCARPTSVDQDAARVVERFLTARQDRNLDAAMECFGDAPEMRSSLGAAGAGRDAVRAILAYRLLNVYTVGAIRGAGNHVVWSEHVQRSVWGSAVADFDEEVEATVVGGRIGRLETYVAGAPPTLLTTPTFQPTGGVWMRPDVLASLGVLVLVVAAVLVWPRAPAVPRGRLQHHLLTGLREYVARRG